MKTYAGLGGLSPKFESGTSHTGVRRVDIELTCSIPTLCCLQSGFGGLEVEC